MSTLYELTGQYMTLLEMAEDPETDPEALEGSMEAISDEIEDKAEGYAKVMKQLDAEASAIKDEIERLTLRMKALQNNKARMNEALQGAMEATGKTKFKTTLFSFAIAKTPAKVVIDEAYIENIPEEYLRYKEPEIDKAKIKEALKAGEAIEWAHLEQGEVLRIK